MRYAATGPSKPKDGFLSTIREALQQLPDPPTQFLTGAAFGVDTAVFALSRGLYPKARQRLFVPKGMFYNTDVATYEGVEINFISGGYLARDSAMVRECDVLLAFPGSKTEVLRSGTWATIRRARKARKRILFTPLDGSERWEE